MRVKSIALGLMVMGGLSLGTWAGPGLAAQAAKKQTMLPRSFQSARLGMTLSELTRVVPDAKGVSLNRQNPAQRTIVIPSKDHAVQGVEYRFYNDRLRELSIHYNHDAVPGGFKELRQRLREAYGEPAVAEQTDYDVGPHIVSVKKTVWKDDATMAVLAQAHKLDQGRELYDVSLTITDRELQQLFEKDQEESRRQEQLRVPIPLPAHGMQNKHMALSHVEGSHM